MPAMSVGGLISGLDTNSIIAQLTAIEQAKVTREVQKKTNAQATLDKFKELQTRLGNVAAKASALELPAKFNVFKTNSNYEDYVTISGKEGASAGQYEVKVNQLASTLKVASKSFAAINTAIGPADGTKITLSTSEATRKADSTKQSVDVSISASDTLKDVVNKINAAEGAGVKASILTTANGENRLVLTAVDSGTNGFSIKDKDGTSWLQDIGILNSSNTTQKATSNGALLDLDGNAATGATTFDKLNTVLARNDLNGGDVLGIYLPAENGSGTPGWITFDLYKKDSSGNLLDKDNNIITSPDQKPVARTIDEVLVEINGALKASGADFTAKLNNSGEIVMEGNLGADGNFGTNLDKVKIQIGTLNSSATITPTAIPVSGGPPVNVGLAGDVDIFGGDGKVKKDMGKLTSRDVFAEVISEGQNAVYTIDGMAVSSQSNTDEKSVNGTVFTLKKVTKDDMEVKLSLELDMDGLATKITEFMDEFNALLKFIDDNAKASIKEETDEATGKKTSKREVGVFTGDSGISSLRDNLKRMLTGTINEITGVLDNGYKTQYSSAARIGFLTEKDGTISVDREKLTKALNADYEGVRKLFTANNFSGSVGKPDDPEYCDPVGFSIGRFTKDSQAGVYTIKGGGGVAELWFNGKKVEGVSQTENILTTKDGLSFELPSPNWASANPNKEVKVTFVRGIANQLSTFVEKAKALTVTMSDGRIVPGYFKQSEKTYQDRIESIEKRIDQLQIRVDNYNARLIKQFSALERSMGNLQSQSANMMSALSTLTTSRR